MNYQPKYYWECPNCGEVDGSMVTFEETHVTCGASVTAKPVMPTPQLSEEELSFQLRVHEWMNACFGPEITYDKIERNHRFLEEALELVQAKGCTKEEAKMLVDYVFARPIGDINQEIGGVMVTLAALCNVEANNMQKAGETELARVWQKIDKIREKQKNKPRNSPLPTAEQILSEAELWKEVKELDATFDYLCKTDGVKDAGHRWIEFSDKWQAFKKKLTLKPEHPVSDAPDWQQTFLKEPVSFLLVNAMKYLNEEQRISLRDALIERTPKIEQVSDAIEFAEWKAKQGWRPVITGNFFNGWIKTGVHGMKKSSEVYDLFLQYKNKVK